MSWAALCLLAQSTSAYAAACAEDLAAGMAAGDGMQVECGETAHAAADARQECDEARMAHEAERDALHSSRLTGGWASEEEEGWGAEGEFW